MAKQAQTTANPPLTPEEMMALLQEAGFELPGEKKETQAEMLVKLALEKVQLWHAPDGTEYATVPVGEHLENWPLSGKAFREFLAYLFFQKNRKPPGAQALQDALSLLSAKARFESEARSVFLRIAGDGNRIYVDLGDEDWSVLEITAKGFQLSLRPPVLFRRSKGMLTLPYPDETGDINTLREFLQLEDEEAWVLIVSWLVTSLRPRGPYPILVLHGEQGSGKSTLARILRSLVDPNTCPLRSTPREERDLVIAGRNGWVLAFDNLSGIPLWLSDALCRISTGGGFSTRRLYTNDEEELFSEERPIVCNGIDEVSERHDFLDRSLIVTLPPIPPEKRRDETTLWGKFESIRPRIFAGLLQAVSAGLRNWDEVRLSNPPRMADFARWICACEEALPWKAGTFLRAYAENRDSAIQQVAELDPLIVALEKLLSDSGDAWEGTATQLLMELSAQVSESVKRSKLWPSTEKLLGKRLRCSASFLRHLGITISAFRTGRKRILRIRRDGNVTNVTNVTSQDLSGFEAVTLTQAKRHANVTETSPLKGASQADGDMCDVYDKKNPTLSNRLEEGF